MRSLNPRADLLRRAAVKLRQHLAEELIPSPWEADGAEIYGEGYTDNGDRFWVGETLHIHTPSDGSAEAAYIVMMHPPVGLALAEMLDAIAEFTEAAQVPGPAPVVLNVARAILRELSEEET